MAHPQTNFSSNFQGVDPPLEGYWHDDPIPCGGGNVVTNIWLNPAGVPVVVKGFNALTDEDIADKLDNTGNASDTTSTFTKASGDTSSMTSGGKLSAIFTAISSFFASLKALAFKDKASYNDLSSGVQSSLDKADSALQSHQSVSDNNPTLSWETTSKVGKVGSTDLRVTMPANPATDKLDIVSEEIGSTAIDLNSFTSANGQTRILRINDSYKANVSNKPIDDSGNVVVISQGGGFVRQMFFSKTHGYIYYRYRVNADWVNWVKMSDASWIDSGTFDAARIPTSLPNVTAGNATKAYVGAYPDSNNYRIILGSTENANNDLKNTANLRYYHDSSNGHFISIGNTSGTGGQTDVGGIRFANGDGTYAYMSGTSYPGNAATATHIGTWGQWSTWTPGAYNAAKPYARIAEITLDNISTENNGASQMFQLEFGNTDVVRFRLDFKTNNSTVTRANVVILESTWSRSGLNDRLYVTYFKYNNDNNLVIRIYVRFYNLWESFRIRQLDAQTGDNGYINWAAAELYSGNGSDIDSPVGNSAAVIYSLVYTNNGSVGSPTIPVYVDSDGQVQPCSQGSTLKSNTATLYISSYYNTTPVYHVKDIKNGCVNYVHVKDTLSSSCNLTIEAPALAADEEYDYVVVFDTFTNNNLVGNIDVENCKTTGHFESGVFVHDTMAISSTAPSQVPMIIVTGNVARPQWYDRV